MQAVELEQGGLEIKFYETTSEQSKEYGLDSTKPLFLKHLLVEANKRNKGNGTQLLKIIDEYAEKNNYDLIFGTIPLNSEFTKDKRICLFSDVEMIKNWLHKNGYSVNTMNDDFHKVIKKEKPLRTFNGIGFNNCLELGKYEVTTEIQIKTFTKLSEAKSFYDESKGEKQIWDLGKNELLDARYRK